MKENNEDDEKHELEKIRLKKMKALMDAKKREEAVKKALKEAEKRKGRLP